MDFTVKIDQSLSMDKTYNTIDRRTNTTQLTLNYHFILGNGNGFQVYQELVIFNTFVKFKSESNFSLLPSPED